MVPKTIIARKGSTSANSTSATPRWPRRPLAALAPGARGRRLTNLTSINIGQYGREVYLGSRAGEWLDGVWSFSCERDGPQRVDSASRYPPHGCGSVGGRARR